MKILTANKQNKILENILVIVAISTLEIEDKSKRTDIMNNLYNILKITNDVFDRTRFWDTYDGWKRLKEKQDKEKNNDANNI